MAGRHWTDDELIDRLYEVGPADGHLEDCEECAERWRGLLAVRLQVLETPRVPEELLADQRRAIYQRLERPPAEPWKPVLGPALAALAMILLGLLVSGPTPSPPPTLASSEAQLWSEVYSVVQSTEPNAVAPIYGLFEVEQ